MRRAGRRRQAHAAGPARAERAGAGADRRGSVLDSRGRTNPNEPVPQDSLQLDIVRSIAQIEAENNPTLEGGFVYRGRFGTAGLSQLNEVALPFDLAFAPFWTGKMTVSMSPVWLDAGTVGGSSLPLFGANQLLAANTLPMVTPGDQSAFGALGSIAYAYGDFSGKIGESAWGFPVVNWIGNVAYNPKGWSSTAIS